MPCVLRLAVALGASVAAAQLADMVGLIQTSAVSQQLPTWALQDVPAEVVSEAPFPSQEPTFPVEAQPGFPVQVPAEVVSEAPFPMLQPGFPEQAPQPGFPEQAPEPWETASPAQQGEEQATYAIRGVPVYGYDISMHGVGKRTTWIMFFNERASDAMMESICAKFNSADNKTRGSRCEYTGHPSENALPMVIIRATEDEVSALPSLQAQYIEVDRKTHLVHPVNVEHMTGMASDQEHWGLDRINQRKGLDNEESYIDTTYASKGAGISIFSLDTGVSTQHPDFGGRAIAEADFTRYNVWTRKNYYECEPNNVVCAADMQGHGTHTAGLAASQTYGVAKEATVHAVKVLGDKGAGQWSWFLSGIDWVVAKVQRDGIKQSIITASLGGQGPSQTVHTSIGRCNMAGISVVVAAGNENDNACKFLPSSIPASITVGAVDEFDERSYFSNYGACVDLFAPGSHIMSLNNQLGGAVSMSGTSMAAPFVAGAAAVILSNNRAMTPAQVQDALKDKSTTNCIRGLEGKGGTANRLLFIGKATDSTDCRSKMLPAEAALPSAGPDDFAAMYKKSWAAPQYPAEGVMPPWLGSAWRR